MGSGLHKDVIEDDIHIIHTYTYADSTARTGATGFLPADVGKVAKQSDDNSYWLLVDDSPITWRAITANLSSTGALYFGDVSTNGTWRIIRDGNNLNFERRESGTYVKKSAMIP